MKDIFISHSSKDGKKLKEFCDFMKKEGFTYWISEDFRDLEVGESYIAQIPTAIKKAKIFVVLISDNSVKSEQVAKEIAIANAQLIDGIKIIPVVISDYDENYYEKNMEYVLVNSQRIVWDESDSRQAISKIIEESLEPYREVGSVQLKSFFPEASPMVGRIEEMAEFAKILSCQKKIYLSGVGGIGKTVFLQNLCELLSKDKEQLSKEQNRKIIYLTVDRCILNTFGKDNVIFEEYEKILSYRDKMTDTQYAFYCLSLLEKSVDENDILILDNFQDNSDRWLGKICDLNCHIVISSRFNELKLDGFYSYTLNELDNQRDLFDLFELNYSGKLPEDEYVYLDETLRDVHNHTMTIVLLAKQMRYFGRKPSDYQDKNLLRMERARTLKEFVEGHIVSDEIADMYLYLLDLLDANILTDSEKTVLKTMCLLPVDGIYRHLYISLLGEEYIPELVKMEKMGWVQCDSNKTIIMLHPLVRDVIIHALQLYLEDPFIQGFFKRIINGIQNSWSNSYSDNKKYKDLVLSIYYMFPDPTLKNYMDYLAISRYLWVLNYMSIGRDLQHKIKNLFVKEDGKHYESSEEAEALLQMGFIYHGSGEYSKAAVELENSMKIFGNRYASAMSHLAQALMEDGHSGIEEIEPLLAKSLEIREQFQKGIVPEGVSCHLYAKVLSAFEKDLDYAIELEKRAYKIFSKKDSRNVNVSSSAYILGWLYVQTAKDAEDIEFGIGKLEEAKEIRLEHRGNPLHFWMEDIYLKLGMAYEKAENYEKARENFDLLVRVRTGKYSGTDRLDQVIDAYKKLRNVCAELEDADGVKRCDKYLKYN